MSNFVHQAYSKAVIALADVIWFLFIGAQMLSHLPIYFAMPFSERETA